MPVQKKIKLPIKTAENVINIDVLFIITPTHIGIYIFTHTYTHTLYTCTHTPTYVYTHEQLYIYELLIFGNVEL